MGVDNPLAWDLVMPSGLVAHLERDATIDDFPWFGVTIVRGPAWGEVEGEFEREQCLLDENRIDDWENLWAGLRSRGLRLILASGREGHLIALHVDADDSGRLRFLYE